MAGPIYKGKLVAEGQDNCIGSQQLSSADLASAVSLTVPTGTRLCMLQVETQSIRYKSDGTDPTSSTGIKLNDGDVLKYTGDPRKLRLIRVTAGAVVNIEYYD